MFVFAGGGPAYSISFSSWCVSLVAGASAFSPSTSECCATPPSSTAAVAGAGGLHSATILVVDESRSA